MLELYMRAENARTRESFDKPRELLRNNELDEMAKSSKEFRERSRLG